MAWDQFLKYGCYGDNTEMTRMRLSSRESLMTGVRQDTLIRYMKSNAANVPKKQPTMTIIPPMANSDLVESPPPIRAKPFTMPLAQIKQTYEFNTYIYFQIMIFDISFKKNRRKISFTGWMFFMMNNFREKQHNM